jgi:cytochrome b subunit of formate dehydrogenase
MELFQVGTDPWGQEILVRLSWGLLTLAFWAGVAFVIFHAVYAVVWKPKVETEASGSSSTASSKIPAQIVRHTSPARVFHWVMAASMLVLLVTGFFPIIGLEFSWLSIHWIAGLVLILCILYHIIHASFFLDFWSIWILPGDLKEAVERTKRQLGQKADVGKHGKYPLDHKLYHLAVSVFGLIVSVTGLLMMMKVENPIIPLNDAYYTDATWGLVYVLHGLSAVLFVTLTITHIYFAVRPEKLWITKSMIWGSVTKEDYLSHFDPKRWDVMPPKPKAKPRAKAKPKGPAVGTPKPASGAAT